MEPVKLTRSPIIQLYCVVRQAERSVDAALFAPWRELTAYYEGERAALARLVLDNLRQLLRGCGSEVRYTHRDEMLRDVAAPGLIRHLSGPWVARLKKRWAFSSRTLGFVAATLQAFLDLLNAIQQPARESLISLRMDLWACEYMIECRCHGFAELPRAMNIEHFNQAAHVVPVRMRQLVATSADMGAVDPRLQSVPSQRELQS